MNSSNGNGEHAISPTLHEIKFAHDLLKLTTQHDLSDVFEFEMDERTAIEMIASLNVLCWILGHDNTSFRRNMVELEKRFNEAGVEFEYNPMN